MGWPAQQLLWKLEEMALTSRGMGLRHHMKPGWLIQNLPPEHREILKTLTSDDAKNIMLSDTVKLLLIEKADR